MRIENRSSWRQYKIHRNEVYEQMVNANWRTDGAETYLWHGSDAVDAEAVHGSDELVFANNLPAIFRPAG